MRTGSLSIIVAGALALCGSSVTMLAEQSETNNPAARTGKAYAGYVFNEFHWVDVPPNWPKGASMALLQGSPLSPGPYTVRYRLPAGYRTNPFWASTDQGITVISGALNVGMPPEYDKSNAKKVGTGSFAFIPAKLRHNLSADEETIIQVTGSGPVSMTFLFNDP